VEAMPGRYCNDVYRTILKFYVNVNGAGGTAGWGVIDAVKR